MMSATTECRGVRVVCTDFQAKPASEFGLSREEALAVSTEAFPRSLPLNVKAAGNYRALKVFPAGASIGVSHVFDGGAVDEWDRPVLSARVALIAPGPENGWGREVHAVGSALARLEGERAGTRAAATCVAGALAQEGILGSRERWSKAAAPYGVPFLARVAHACATGRDVVFVTGDTPEARKLLTLAFAFLPASRLGTLRACTACTNADAEAREDVVFLPAPAAPGGRSLLARLTGRPGAGDRIEIDLASRLAPSVRGGRVGPNAFAAALSELLDAPPWPGLSFVETHGRLLECLDALWLGQEKALLKTAKAELPEELLERLQGFVKKATARPGP